jgi:hypothetical protein
MSARWEVEVTYGGTHLDFRSLAATSYPSNVTTTFVVWDDRSPDEQNEVTKVFP